MTAIRTIRIEPDSRLWFFYKLFAAKNNLPLEHPHARCAFLRRALAGFALWFAEDMKLRWLCLAQIIGIALAYCLGFPSFDSSFIVFVARVMFQAGIALMPAICIVCRGLDAVHKAFPKLVSFAGKLALGLLAAFILFSIGMMFGVFVAEYGFFGMFAKIGSKLLEGIVSVSSEFAKDVGSLWRWLMYPGWIVIVCCVAALFCIVAIADGRKAPGLSKYYRKASVLITLIVAAYRRICPLIELDPALQAELTAPVTLAASTA